MLVSVKRWYDTRLGSGQGVGDRDWSLSAGISLVRGCYSSVLVNMHAGWVEVRSGVMAARFGLLICFVAGRLGL